MIKFVKKKKIKRINFGGNIHKKIGQSFEIILKIYELSTKNENKI